MGIINMHPGLLPENRGLDNLKWALIKKIPQGVTSHFIDNKIDKGALIDMQKIKIYKDDTLLDIHLRLQNKEQEMMINALKNIQEPEFKLTSLKKLGSGDTYHRSVTPELEKDLHLYLNKYVEKFGE
jgi:phosphoribosylglycinamide formyltransferase-1